MRFFDAKRGLVFVGWPGGDKIEIAWGRRRDVEIRKVVGFPHELRDGLIFVVDLVFLPVIPEPDLLESSF